jgi:hypothetical protein
LQFSAGTSGGSGLDLFSFSILVHL